MKQSFLITQEQLGTLNLFPYIDRDRGQVDKYEGRAAVKFPCALISISQPKRKNLTSQTQEKQLTITIRLAFERLHDASNLNNALNRAKALQYYETVESVDELLQGYRNDYFAAPWECTSCVDEQRPDMDIVRLVFTTKLIK